MADELDAKIMSDAQLSGAAGYADLVALSLRQTMASIEITVPVVDGKLDANDVKSFMKDVGETGCVFGCSVLSLKWSLLSVGGSTR